MSIAGAVGSAVCRMSFGFRLAAARELVAQVVVDQLVVGLGPDGGERLLDLHPGSSQIAALAALGMSPGRVVTLSLGVDACANPTDARVTRHGYLPVADASFDVVLSRLALNCLPAPAHRARFVREIARALKPGGCLIVLDHSDPSDYVQMLKLMQLTLTECYSESLLLFPRLTLFRASIGLNSNRLLRYSPRGDGAVPDVPATAL